MKRLVLRDAQGHVLDGAEVKGPVWFADPDITLRAGKELVATLNTGSGSPTESGRRPDTLVGRIPFLERSSGSHWEPRELIVPPPPPFTTPTVDLMWRRAVELPGRLPRSVDRQGLWSAERSLNSSATGVELPIVALVNAWANRLLDNWPSVESQEVLRRPVDLPGGREDIKRTQRMLSRGAQVVEVDERRFPDRTMRVRGSTSQWRLRSIAELSSVLVERLQKLPRSGDNAELEALLRPIWEAGATAAPDRRSPDPPPSSWPPVLKTYLRLLVAALSTASATGLGHDSAPLCHLWQLYERWVAAEVWQALERRFGPPAEVEAQPDVVAWQASWVVRETEVRLGYQTAFGKGPTALSGASYVAASADLLPDLVLTVGQSDQHRTLVIDAKRRSADHLRREDAATEGSKYLWGIRRAGDSGIVPAIAGVVLASTAGEQQPMHLPGRALIEVVRLTPSSSTETGVQAPVDSWLRDLLGLDV